MIKNSTLILMAFLLIIGNAFAEESNPPPACPTIQMSGASVACYGQSNGRARVTILSGGSGNYTYTWSQGTVASGSGFHEITNLIAGTYTVTVRDNVSGCTVVGAYVVGTPNPITISGTVTNVNCFGGSTGSISTIVNGGNNPYTFTWKNSSGVTISTGGAGFNNLNSVPAGTYTLTVLASATQGCTFSKSFTITQPIEALNASSVITHVNCFGFGTGSIDATVWGGTAPYAYSWDSGDFTQDISSITSGSYNLTITDSKGCVKSLAHTVTQPTMLSASPMTSTDVLCFGDATGTATIAPMGGTAPYSYSWQNSTTLFSQNTPNITGMLSDVYQVQVTDAKGCTYVDNILIDTPTKMVGSTVGTNVKCYGGSDGAVDLTISGGVLPYDFEWTNSTGAVVGAGEDLALIPAETYTVEISDDNNCKLFLTQEILQPLAPIAVTTSVVDVLCKGNNTGSIDLLVSGGTLPYTFNWSNGQTTEDISNLLADLYTYGIVDANGCTFGGSETVIEPLLPLTVTNIITDVNCYGESNGIIDLTVFGGTAPYSFQWTNSTFELSATSEDLINYPMDSYRYEVTDAHGCKEIDTLDINEPPVLTISNVPVHILCKGGNNGSVDITVNGGVTPYSYSWNNGFVSEDISNLIAGYYEVLVTDDHGCTISDNATLTEPLDSLRFSTIVKDVLCKDGTDGEIELTITGGTTPYSYLWSNSDTEANIDELTAGYYVFNVTDFNNCILIDSAYVDEPDALTLNEVITDVTCFGFSDGIIDISPVGGTLPYSYTWYNSQFALSSQTEDLVDYPAETYQLEIIDSNNCFYEMFLNLPEPEKLEIEYTFNVVSCNLGSDANILVDITGGNPGYITNWSNGSTIEDQFNIPANTYQLNVIDTKGCEDSIIVDISEPAAITVSFDFTEVTCIDNLDGTATAYPAGGNGGYFYEWSNGETSSFNENLLNQYYSVLITDVLGCNGTDSVFITKNLEGCIEPVNAFSPNDDNYNDTWVIDNMDLYPDANVQIFNRWGNIVHEQTGLYEPWDGFVRGAPAPSELYYWIINLNFPDREVLKGNITIVR
jgi:gliding motility-associated-like protein